MKRGRGSPFDYESDRKERANCKLTLEKGVRCDLWAKNGAAENCRRRYLRHRESATVKGRARLATTNDLALGPGNWGLNANSPGAPLQLELKNQEAIAPGVAPRDQDAGEGLIRQAESGSVAPIALAQSGDPQWRVARASRFTSASAICALEAARGGEAFAEALGADINVGSAMSLIFRPSWSSAAVADRKRDAGAVEARNTILNPRAEAELMTMTKPALLYLLSLWSSRENQSLRKSHLVTKALHLQGGPSSSGDHDGPFQARGPLTDDQKAQKAALHSWAFRPIKIAAAMELGSKNEIKVIRALPKFSAANASK